VIGGALLLRLVLSVLMALGVGLLTLALFSGVEQRQMRQAVAALAESVRFHVDSGLSLSTALLLVLDERAADPGWLWQQLRAHRDLLTLEGPEALLRAVAAEGNLPEVHDLLRNVRASRAEGAMKAVQCTIGIGGTDDEATSIYPTHINQGGGI